jgi:arabinoxylan arabinofuranohydrolase
MFSTKILVYCLVLFCSCSATQNLKVMYPYKFSFQGNPVLRHIRAADPDCVVFPDGKLWMYTSQDNEPTPASEPYSKMDGYHAFSTNDMINWVDHGEILHSRDVKWGLKGGGYMWAAGAACRNNKYYLYFSHKDTSNRWRIGVAVSNNAAGPFVAEPNYIQGTKGIDPKCFIDDDGQAYLYFGNALVAKLKDNMIKLAEEPRLINYGASNLREGIYMHKRNGIYYFSYTDWEDEKYQGYYAMGNNPYGPFSYKGPVNPPPPGGAQDHHSVIEYKGVWYYFYHVGNFVDKNGINGAHNRRNTSVEYLFYNQDGTMQMVKQSKEGVRPQ